MNENSKWLWVGFVVIVLVVIFGLWWFSSNQPIDSSTAGLTPATSTGSTAGNTNPNNVASIPSRTSRPADSVVAIVDSLSGASQFKALFHSTGVAATVAASSTAKYTIFVPTDGAFSHLTPGTITNLSTADKKRLIQYHIVSGRVVDVDAQTAGTIQALSKDMLNFNYGENKIPMVNSAIIIAEYKGKNGIVYLVNNVLLLPQNAR
jgi:uncharacterized surface protein with fasciclin (FAS1) repeats